VLAIPRRSGGQARGEDHAEWRIPEYVTLAVKVVTPHPEIPVEADISVTPDAPHSFNSSNVCRAGEVCTVTGSRAACNDE